ncbi:MAG TPA: multiheme c-type cytochrome [Sphingomonas sp.]|nr:multiheme c-type cytochrome [Sphingomonas sp.]
MRRARLLPALIAAAFALAIGGDALMAKGESEPVQRHYVAYPPAPASETQAEADAKSAGCKSCHTATDQATMHPEQSVVLGCADCHGGDPTVSIAAGIPEADPRYIAARDKAHVLPRYPKEWNWPSPANPVRSYTLLNKEAPEYIRFVNPSDYRVARQACGACHLSIIEASERSLMATGAMFWGGGSYNNGVQPFKNYIFGEAYTRDGQPAKLLSPGHPVGTVTPAEKARGALPVLYPLPTWEVVPPSDVFRVFERGGRVIGTQFAEIGLPNPTGSIQKLDEPGRPDIRQSNRGPGTGLRVSISVLNLHKTRLNDPFTWMIGTNDQPGDYRQSGCASCHVVYANDRDPKHSLQYARYGRDGQTATVDPTIANRLQPLPKGHPAIDDGMKEVGHPIHHAFTRAIPTEQCMICHMHQPNVFLNSYLGYTMWDYETAASLMWPKKQKYPTANEVRAVNDRNPEGAAPRGNWADLDFLRRVVDDVNPKATETQFADYHGHGWNFRAVYKRDREGNLLDAKGNIIPPNDPEKFRKKGMGLFAPVGQQAGKAVHLMDIHAEKGMQCVDCHFANDNHGTGLIYGEVANAIEIGCKDCHGTADALPTLRTSGPAAPPHGTDLTLLRNPDGQRRFEWTTDQYGERELIQRSAVDPKLSWRVSLVKETVDKTSHYFNPKAARAKLMSVSGAETGRFAWGPGVPLSKRAHDPNKMACFTCHLSWTTSCGGCHLPIEANWKTKSHKYGGEETRNFATYNPQVARQAMFQLGIHMTTKGHEITPVRSSSALMLSSTNVNRERIYVQQPPISSIGFSSQAFAPHFPHTVRTTETKQCTDCHLSKANDNNAIMAQLMLLGTNFVNFVGMNSWVGLEHGIEAVRVTEWEEPQAVFGSYLQRFAYPDYYRLHVERNHRELINWDRGTTFDRHGSGESDPVEQIRNVVHGTDGAARCLQLRGEYMFVAEGKGGFRVYDVASIANKAVSEKIITAPFSPLGHDAHVKTTNATCMALPTDQPIAPLRNTPWMRKINQEQPFEPIYHYAAITDSVEGLILVNVDTMADGEPRNNFLHRAVTWNPHDILKGARHIILAGEYAYIAADAGVVVVNLADPLHPKLTDVVRVPDPRATALQFRYLWVTTARGLEVFDVTHMDHPVPVPGAIVPLADARRVYVARTYAYVAAGKDGLVIVNVTNPEKPKIYERVTFGGKMNDAQDVVIGATNASLFAYVADGRNGLKVIQLLSPTSQPNFYGFSPAPMPELIAWARTPSPALALSKGLDRDRAVDETGGQIAVFGRLGSRPFTRPEMERFFMNSKGQPWKVDDEPHPEDWVGARK